jgi:hypothetical protein
LLEHYDPAYKRSSHHNFTQLSEARQLDVASPEEASFIRASEALLEAVPA